MGYSLKAQESTDFELAPEGPTAARCIDIIDHGLVWSEFYNKASHKFTLVFETAHKKSDGSAQLQVRKRYTLSLHKNAALTADLISWRGKAFTESEKKEFEIENVLGAPAFLNIIHNNGYANIQSIMKLPQGTEAPAVPEDYVREIEKNPSKDYRSDHFQNPYDNQQQTQPVQQREPVAAGFEPDDTLPF